MKGEPLNPGFVQKTRRNPRLLAVGQRFSCGDSCEGQGGGFLKFSQQPQHCPQEGRSKIPGLRIVARGEMATEPDNGRGGLGIVQMPPTSLSKRPH